MNENTNYEKMKFLLSAVKNAFLFMKKSYSKNCNSDLLISAFSESLKKDLNNFEIVYDFVCGKDENQIEGITKNHLLSLGDTVILDASVFFDGIWCDITRTFFIENVSPLQNQRFNLIKNSLLCGESALKIGNTASDVFSSVNREIEKSGVNLIHHAGHKIDKTPVSNPEFVLSDKTVLNSGFYAIESGIYKDFGIRLEDNYFLSQKGLENLSIGLMPFDIKEYLLK